MTVNFEALCPETISGVDVIEDVVNCVVDALRVDSNLLPSNAYSGYSAKIMVALSLQDVDSVEVEKTVVIGEPDSSLPTREVAIPFATAEEVLERAGLTAPDLSKPIGGVAEAPTEKPKRYYTPRAARKTVPLTSKAI
jgi:hypothetical protein